VNYGKYQQSPKTLYLELMLIDTVAAGYGLNISGDKVSYDISL